MKRILLPLSLVLVLFTVGCGNRGSDPQASSGEIPSPAIESQTLQPVDTPKLDEGIIAYISGEVDIAAGNGWFPAEIGDMVTPAHKIRTTADSSCEIQFGRVAVIRLQENTEIDIHRIQLSPGASKVGIAMAAGTVLSKVQKLSGDDGFSIRTQSAVCGVRGTEFSVSTDASGHSVFAVKEGSVAILPPNIDTDELREQLAGRSPEAGAFIDELLESAPRIEADQEIALGPDFAGKTREAADSINRRISELASAATSEEKEDQTRNLAKAAAETAQIISAAGTRPAEISPEQKEVLKRTEKMRILEIPLAADKEDGANAPKTRLHKLAVKADPEDSRILLNGEHVGTGSYAALFEEGSSLSFTLQRDGYADYRLSVSVNSESARLYSIGLAALSSEAPLSPAPPVPAPQAEAESEAPSVPAGMGETRPPAETEAVPPAVAPSAPSAAAPEPSPPVGATSPPPARAPEDPAARVQPVSQPDQAARVEAEITTLPEPPSKPEPAPAGPGTVRISITAFPADAVIRFGDKTYENGRAGIEAMPGDRLPVRISRRGFAEQKITLTAGEAPAGRHIVLRGQPVLFSREASDTALIGVTATEDHLVVSDSRGTLSTLDMDGKVLWQVESLNRPNENNIPVVLGSRVIFSGGRELLIADLLTGRNLRRIALDSGRSHLFGRRAVPFKGKLLYPSLKALEILDPDTGTFSRFAGTGSAGSRMTPGIYHDLVLIADQEGSLLMLSNDGSLETRIPTGALQPLALAVSVHDDLAIFSGRRGNLVCLDLQTRTIAWERTLEAAGISVASDIEVSDSGLYLYGMDGTIYGLDLNDGTELFAPIRGAATPPSLLVAGTQFVYGTRDRKLILADTRTGVSVKSLQLEDQPSARPVIIPGDTLIALGTKQGRIILIEPEGIQ